MSNLPLCVDLDGTLLRTDMLHESIMSVLKHKPLSFCKMPFWVLMGKSKFKRRLATISNAHIAYELLPYHFEFLAFLEREANKGRIIDIVSASDELFVDHIVDHLPWINKGFGSDGIVNLSGYTKAEFLTARYPNGFEYAGNSLADLPVWQVSSGGYVVGATPRLAEKVAGIMPLLGEFDRRSSPLLALLKELRLHHWVKNVLLFVPALLAQVLFSWRALELLFGFVLMGVLASATYIINDLLDLGDDRASSTKCHRPFACGGVPLAWGLVAAPLMVTGVLGSALWFSPLFAACLLVYFLSALSYSLHIKKFPVLDVFFLGYLYTWRIVIGGVMVDVHLSLWLLVFSMFLFSSLGFAKRYTELSVGEGVIKGRNYIEKDSIFIMCMGISFATLSIFVFVLLMIVDPYLPSKYENPNFLLIPLISLLLWISRIWFLTSRGELNQDPIEFAVKDRVSVVLGIFSVLGVLIAGL
jgi:4-hydroxybenzoate polyprenyltransferase